ncbi:MAG: hypothetical protein KAS72_11110 [Phycisphaerales bacterium]|nr:hypothetical protein [Phycisphaerales bacterium]
MHSQFLRDRAREVQDVAGATLDTIWSWARELQPFQKGKTEQGREHCQRVERNIGRLFKQAKIEEACCPAAAYVLSAAAALHDIDKVELADDSFLRTGLPHGRQAAEWIRDYEAFAKLIRHAEYRELIATLIQCHDDGNFANLKESRSFDGQVVFPPSLAGLFRLADMLDASGRRAPQLCMDLKTKQYTENREVWKARNAITDWLFSDKCDAIWLQCCPRTPTQAKYVQTLIAMSNTDVTSDHRAALVGFKYRSVGKDEPRSLPHVFEIHPDDKERVNELALQRRGKYDVVARNVTVIYAHDPNELPLVVERFVLCSRYLPKTTRFELAVSGARIEELKCTTAVACESNGQKLTSRGQSVSAQVNLGKILVKTSGTVSVCLTYRARWKEKTLRELVFSPVGRMKTELLTVVLYYPESRLYDVAMEFVDKVGSRTHARCRVWKEQLGKSCMCSWILEPSPEDVSYLVSWSTNRVGE